MFSVVRRYYLVVLWLIIGCSSPIVDRSEYSILTIAADGGDVIIYKIDDEYVGKTYCKVGPGYHKIMFCRRADFICHSCVEQEYCLQPRQHYFFRFDGNFWQLSGPQITIEKSELLSNIKRNDK